MNVNPQPMQNSNPAFPEDVNAQLEQARRNLEELNGRVVSFIRANPGTCLLGALALGFIVGKLASRR